LAKVGDEAAKGQPLARLHVGRPDRADEAAKLVRDAYTIGSQRVRRKPLILGQVR